MNSDLLWARTATALCAGGSDFYSTTADIGSAVPQPLSRIMSSTDASNTLFLSSHQQFEPVLNVPAFSVFVLVAILFLSLQWRVAAIEQATTERTRALEELRRVKTQQLADGNNSNNNNNNNNSGTSSTEVVVQQALEAYEQAYWKVERLRTIIPGLARLVPPPPSSLTPTGIRSIREENEAAAQQFLGIVPVQDDDLPSGAADDGERPTLSPALVAILAVVALSQIALLVLLVATDPMLTNEGGLGETSTSVMVMERVVDAVNGLE